MVRAVLSHLEIPHAIVRSTECITGRHLLTKILWGILEALGLKDEWERFGKGRCEHVSLLAVLLAECLASPKAAESRSGKVVLVLDGIDKQREAPQTLLSALARLGEVIPSLCVVLILSSTPRPLFLQSAAVPHISFPPYTRKEAIAIILGSEPPFVDDLAPETVSKLYPHFVSTVYDALVGPTAGTIPVFKSTCEKLWPQFVAPIVNGDTPPGTDNTEWDFSRLLVRNRAMFGRRGESTLVHHIVPPEAESVSSASSKLLSTPSEPGPPLPALPSLPYFATLVLTSAYLAAHIPARLDTIFFSKFSSSSLSARNKRAHHRRRLKKLSQAPVQADDNVLDLNQGPSTPSKKGKRQKTRITKSTLESAFATSSATISAIPGGGAGAGGSSAAAGAGIAGSSTILTARPFPLERLIAIYHAIDPNPPSNPIRVAPAADVVYTELATLRRLRLVVPASGGATGTGTMAVDAGEKWCVNVSGGWIAEMAKGIGVEVGEWLAGGLD
ncbi:hypothetical protein MPDQ_007952 [Monascus purpureus]|uniref:Uncharacterized protein n=1 Tax=Monascus purpureus TaxID=5098 RepID=A0A507QUZ6_MONPU|nr:hypothetical protein MPDQ_007952 [Monascus purpureus]BDD55806.1 hypothetical protein MAP00_001291 [Monascus purpureus]